MTDRKLPSCPTSPRSSLSARNAGRWSRPPCSWISRQGRVTVRSAGTSPGERVDLAVSRGSSPTADSTSPGSNPSGSPTRRLAADIVITMGCGDSCPVYPGQRSLDWDLADPAGKAIDDVRPIVDEIERRVVALLSELGIAPPPAEPTSFAMTAVVADTGRPPTSSGSVAHPLRWRLLRELTRSDRRLGLTDRVGEPQNLVWFRPFAAYATAASSPLGAAPRTAAPTTRWISRAASSSCTRPAAR